VLAESGGVCRAEWWAPLASQMVVLGLVKALRLDAKLAATVVQGLRTGKRIKD